MVSRYKIYPYLDKQRNLNIAKELDKNGDWVRYREVNQYIKDVDDEKFQLQKKCAELKEQNKKLMLTLDWYADIDNWLPPEGSSGELISFAEKDQGDKARGVLSKFRDEN
jgi:uncharacterized membrane protein YukC